MQITKNHLYLFLFFFGILLFTLTLVYSILSSRKEPSPSLLPSPTPQQKESVQKTEIIQPYVPYAPGSIEKTVQKMKQPEQLSSQDSTVRRRIITSLKNASGVAYESSLVRIEFIKAPDIFEAEIKNTDITRAKLDAINWFKRQGLSEHGICNLPFSFYLSSETTFQLRNANIVFDPLPENCQ